jgi:8-oxo-dGTP pyrophosphatase MutT (NUDIX family)
VTDQNYFHHAPIPVNYKYSLNSFVGVPAGGDIILIILLSLMKTRQQKSTHAPTMAAGGVVVTPGRSPLIAVVQRRKDDGWVLPRGKIRPNESAPTAARREVERETGHSVVVREFLGTISYDSGGRPKIIQFWLMASLGRAGQELTSNAKAVKWLPLNAAVASLTEPLEQSFLAQIAKQSLRQPRIRLRRDKFGKSLDGRQAPKLRAATRTGGGPRDERSFRIKTLDRGAPDFIRRFFRRLKSPRFTSNRGGFRLI